MTQSSVTDLLEQFRCCCNYQ